MSNEDAMAGGVGAAGAAGRPRSPRQGVGGSPVGSTLSIVLALLAVVAGFLILKNIKDGTESGATTDGLSQTDGADDTTPDDTAVDDTTTTTSTISIRLNRRTPPRPIWRASCWYAPSRSCWPVWPRA